VDSRCPARAALPEQQSEKKKKRAESTGKRRVYGLKK